MQKRFVMLAHVPSDSVALGFLPAVRRRDLPLLLITDQPDRYHGLIERGLLQQSELLPADVFNPLAILNALAEHQVVPMAVFSNSDHLQSSTSIVADFHQLPGKDWQACLRAKNKLIMRYALRDAGLDELWFRAVRSPQELADIPLPCVVKPISGVASEDVSLARSPQELADTCQNYWRRHPGQPLLLEEYLAGPLHTLETLGDGRTLQVMGSFETFLSEPPAFIELGQRFRRNTRAEIEACILERLTALGVGFGSCHTEFVLTDSGPRLIEVNYRNIGDHSDFLLAQALDFDLFDAIVGLYLGEPLPSLPDSSSSAAIQCMTAEQSGTVTHVPRACHIERDGCSVDFEPLCSLHDRIDLQHSNRDYLGILRGTGPSDALLTETLSTLAAELEIIVSPLTGEQEAAA